MSKNTLIGQIAMLGAATAAGYAVGKLRGSHLNLLGGRGILHQVPYKAARPIHPVPHIPIKLDGTRVAADAVLQFKGQALYYVWDR